MPTTETIKPVTSGGKSRRRPRRKRESTAVKTPLTAVIPNTSGKPPILPARIVGARYVRLHEAGQRYPEPKKPPRACRIVVSPEAIMDKRNRLSASALLPPWHL